MRNVYLSCVITLFFFSTSWLHSQPKVAILPIKNMDGRMEFNVYSTRIADSLRSMFILHEQNGKQFSIVSKDSISAILATINTNPDNAQYESDVWTAIEKAGCMYAVTGSFNIEGSPESRKILLNVYCYQITNKTADQTHAAKNIFKAPEKILETIPNIIKKLLPAIQ